MGVPQIDRTRHPILWLKRNWRCCSLFSSEETCGTCLMMWRAPDTRPRWPLVIRGQGWGNMRDPRPLIGPESPSLASDWLTSWQRLGCAEQRPGATNPCFNVYKNCSIDLISSEARLGCVRIIWIAHLHNVAADCGRSILFPQWLQSAYLLFISYSFLINLSNELKISSKIKSMWANKRTYRLNPTLLYDLWTYEYIFTYDQIKI